MLCEDYRLMDGILFKIRYVKEHKGRPTLVLCVPEKYIPTILYQYHTPLLAGHPCVMTMYQMVRKSYYFPTMLPLIKQFVASCLVDQKAGTIADAIFFRIICEYGTPKAIICDEGPAFTSDLMKMYFHAMNIKPYYISPMNHGSNRAERYIRTLNDVCRNLTGIGDKWPLFLLPSCWAMNTPSFQDHRIFSI